MPLLSIKCLTILERYELKYLVDLETLVKIEKTVQIHGFADPQATQKKYNIISTYFDSPDLKAYYQKKDGVRHRKKYRLRTYGKNPEYGFFEIKYRNGNKVSKLRIKLSKDKWEKLIFENDDSIHNIIDKLSTDEQLIINSIIANQLEPTHIVSYWRKAYIIPQETPFRITFDLETSGSPEKQHDLSQLSTLELYPGYGILEIKIHDQLPLWCYQMLKEFRIYTQSLSKYALTMERLGLV